MNEFGSLASARGCQHLALLRGQQRSILVLCFEIVAAQFTAQAALSARTAMLRVVLPNVGGKLAPTVGRAGQVGENVQRTACLARVARRWGSA